MSIHETIQNTVMSWPGVTEEPHRFGGIQFSLGKRAHDEACCPDGQQERAERSERHDRNSA